MSSNAVTDLVKQLSEPPDPLARQAAANTLGNLGTTARPALSDLYRRLDLDDDEDVRSSILRAIAKLEEDKGKLVTELIKFVDDPVEKVRAAAVETLAGLGAEAKDALNTLWTRLSGEYMPEAIENLVQAIQSIETDRAALMESCLNSIGSNAKRAKAAAHVLVGLKPTGTDEEKIAKTLWDVIRKSEDKDIVSSAFYALARIASNKKELVTQFIGDSSLASWKKSFFILFNDIKEAINNVWKNDPNSIKPLILDALADDYLRGVAITCLDSN